MMQRWVGWRAIALGVVLASCGGNGGAPQSPVAPAPVVVGAGAGYVMASSQGLAPEGFKLAMKLDPKPGEDGIIRAGEPVTVEVDLCGSTADDGKTLHYLFDWDFNDLADVAGTGDDCVQKHTYRAPKDATKDVVLESNVCVTNGDPGVHNGSTYFSCRTIRVALQPRPQGVCAGAFAVPEGCYAYQGGTFGWEGGAGPYDAVAVFEGVGDCSGQAEIESGPYAAACSEAEAAQLCGGPANYIGINFGGDVGLYFCGQPPV